MQTRVLLIFSSSELGGAERSLSRMAFASKTMEYQLATLGDEGPWCDWVRSQGHIPLVYGGHGGLFEITRQLYRDIRNHSVDMVYVCGIRASLLLRLLLIFIPRVGLVHGVRWNPDSDSRLDRFFRLVEWLMHPLVDGWITNSAIAKETLVRRCHIPSKKVHVIYNGLESIPSQVPPLRERPLEVLTVANLSARKGYLEYLSVVLEVANKVPGVRFVFVGRDDMNGAVQQEITRMQLENVVEYLGFQADVSLWFERARVFVLPSLWNEGCPTSILEAMSHSVPCVAFRIDGIPELVETGRQGILLQKGDYAGMSQAVIDFLGNDELAAGNGAHGRHRVKHCFKLSDTVEQHETVLKTVFTGMTN